MEVDKKTVKNVILRYARRDYLNGVGRVFYKEIAEICKTTPEKIREILREMKREGYEIRFNENLALITLEPRPKRKHVMPSRRLTNA